MLNKKVVPKFQVKRLLEDLQRAEEQIDKGKGIEHEKAKAHILNRISK
ncbi:MAG: hypothetical protein HY807_00140 [Nitrospirae bacterium]|nr:hypothetical protein [Nitrospirota bacterium]